MQKSPDSVLINRLAEIVLRDWFPCDLGEGIEVVHDVEAIEVEMSCDLADEAWYSAPYARIEVDHAPVAARTPDRVVAALGIRDDFERSPVWDTLPFAPFEPDEVHGLRKSLGAGIASDDAATTRFARVEASPGEPRRGQNRRGRCSSR